MSLTTGGYYCGFLCVVASCERVAPETTGTGGDRRPETGSEAPLEESGILDSWDFLGL